MDIVDILLLVLVAGALFHGTRVGAISQIVSFVGFMAGLAIGAGLVLLIDPHVPYPVWKTVTAVALLLIPATLLGNVGRLAGIAAWRALRRVRLGLLDSIAGALVAVASMLVVAWLVASVLINSTSTSLSSALSRSVILRRVVAVMPPVPDAFATVQRYLIDNRYPEVLANILPEEIGPATSATSAQVVAAVRSAGPAVVKVIAFGCDEEQEGSGFVVAPGIVVTNAHVVAGTTSISVDAQNGASSSAMPIWFDPDLDLAVLRTDSLGTPSLTMSAGYVERGGPAVVLGYPGGGPFTSDRAGILARFDAVGRNIYDSKLTTRTVYELQAIVRPGNSGGPLVLPDGEVIGVVFSRSSTNPDIGYALSSPAVLAEVRQVESDHTEVSTEGCTN